jgi:hypothetical protein
LLLPGGKMKTVLFGFLLLLACAPAQLTREQVDTLDYGGSICTNYRQIIKAYFDEVLLDPGSAQYTQMTAPEKLWYQDPFPPFQVFPGHFVFLSVNAKNAFGGYTGFKMYCFIFKGDFLTEVLVAEPYKYFKKVGENQIVLEDYKL